MAYTQNDAYLMTACRRVASGQFPEQVGRVKLTMGPEIGGSFRKDAWWEMIPPMAGYDTQPIPNRPQVSALIFAFEGW
jgi:hypothetical protein